MKMRGDGKMNVKELSALNKLTQQRSQLNLFCGQHFKSFTGFTKPTI